MLIPFICYVTFLLTSKALVAFNISSSHGITSLPNRRFLYDQFLISKHLSILHVLLDSQPHVQGFHIFHLYKNFNHLILYTHTNIHHELIFALNYIHFHLIHIPTHSIHAEPKILFHLLLTLNQTRLHPYCLLYLEHIPWSSTLTVNG